MFTTYHFNSANDITVDIIDSIKASFKSKAITITVEEENKYSSGRISLPQYNEELLVSENEFDAGDFISQNEFIKEVKEW